MERIREFAIVVGVRVIFLSNARQNTDAQGVRTVFKSVLGLKGMLQTKENFSNVAVTNVDFGSGVALENQAVNQVTLATLKLTIYPTCSHLEFSWNTKKKSIYR